MLTKFAKYVGCSLLLCLFVAPAWAQDEDNGEEVLDDVTMEVTSNPDADEEEYVDEIALPESATDATDEAEENAAFGIETANQARELGADTTDEARDFGEDTLDRLQDRARDLGRDADNAGKAPEGAGDAADAPPENRPVEVP